MRVGRILLIPLTVMVAVAGLGLAAPIVQPPEPETLVEGHSVFTVIEQVNNGGLNEEQYAAAVAVLVREVSFSRNDFRFPGVLWFNDQYLVNPRTRTGNDDPTYRYPCSGAVIAVPAGDPDPTVDPLTSFAQTNYVESYSLKDPADFTWTVDKWNVGGRPVWTVAINSNDAQYSTPDDGSCTGIARSRTLCAGPNVLPWNYEDDPSPYNDSGFEDNRRINPCGVSQGAIGNGALMGYRGAGDDNGYNYICGGKDTSPKPSCGFLKYNALLFFFLGDLDVAGGVKDHRDGATDRKNDVSGCDADSVNMTVPSYEVYPCPAADDDREGNSHAYNPDQRWPITTYAGRNNHGGSADCTGDAVGDQYCHATRLIDIYYGVARLPVPRNTIFTDTEGYSAPYHCHDTTPTPTSGNCNQDDVFGQTPISDPVPRP